LPEPRTQDHIRVFIVEDDPMVADINRRFTERLDGFRVVGVSRNGEQALKSIKEKDPDLVLLDVFMPKLDGLKLMKRIRSLGLNTDIILVTAADDTETISAALRHGAVDYIIKPFEFERLKKALDSYRERHIKLKSLHFLKQEDLDTIYSTGTPPGDKLVNHGENLPKGLNHLTMNQILKLLQKEKHPLSAREVGRLLGVSRITAHRYLDYLQKEGRVEVKLEYGSVGRPTCKYFLAHQPCKPQENLF